jgi:hypothetical protein
VLEPPVVGRVTRRHLVLAVAALALIAGVLWPAAPPPRPVPPPGAEPTTDAKAFAAVVDRLRAGEHYYDAMGTELRRRDYPTRDPFNWRTPLHLVTIALVPWAVSRAGLTALLVGFYVAVMLLTRKARAALFAHVLVLGVLVLSAAPDAVFVSEAWAGALIGVSACLFALGHRPAAVTAAVAALFVRELAAPYCVLCACSGLLERRLREFTAWVAGAAVYAAYYAWHVGQVAAHRLPSDFAHGESWLTVSGLPFLQATLLKLGWFALVPNAVSAVALALLAAGLAASETPRALRLSGAVYAGFFLVAGFPFNDYWGFVAAPVWAVVCSYGAAAITSAGVSASSEPAGPAPADTRPSHC